MGGNKTVTSKTDVIQGGSVTRLKNSSVMENMIRSEPCQESEILFLPFLNQPASSYDILFNAIKFVISDTVAEKQSVCILTINQPFY